MYTEGITDSGPSLSLTSIKWIQRRLTIFLKFSYFKIDVDQMLKAITYFLEYIIENLLLPGQVENWVIIQDLNGMGVTSLPLGVRFSLY
jgi:hypothetical protein